MYELVIAWETGDKDVYEYATQEAAEQAGRNMEMALGEQIRWYGTRRKLH